MVLLFLGPPGSGKDTQAELLKEKHGFEIISTGDLIREEMATGSELGKQLKVIYDAGKWTPDDLTYGLLRKRLEEHKDTKNFILTGAVRRGIQVAMLDELLEKLNLTLDKVIYFDLDDETLIARSVGRLYCPVDDMNYNTKFNPPKVPGICDNDGAKLLVRELDKEENVRKRLQENRETVTPILEAYEQRGILHHVDASPTIEQIAVKMEELLQLKN